MRQLISRFMARMQFNNTQACIILIGEDLELMSRYLFEKEEYRQHTIFQIIADETVQTLPPLLHHGGVQQHRLNLHDIRLINAFVTQLGRAGYVIDVCVFQATWHIDHSNILPAVQQLQYDWQQYALTAIGVSQVVIRQMLSKSKGTLIFLGGGQGLRPDVNMIQQSIQASIQALAQSLAREFQPKGIHIVHCALAAWDHRDPVLMRAISQACWHLDQQPCSTWTQELRI